MSLSATAGAAAASASSAISFHPHGHKRGQHAESSPDATTQSSSTTSGQAPATTQGLFSSLLSTLAQVAVRTNPIASVALSALTPATTAAASAATPSTTTAASSATGPSDATQTFLHSLFAALKADGLGAPPPAAATNATVATTATTATTAGHYEGSLASSLQTLIQQLGSNGAATANPATANLSASFNNLVQSVNGASATGGAGSSNQSLTTFLNSLLQNVQSNGGHALSSLGGNVNAKV